MWLCGYTKKKRTEHKWSRYPIAPKAYRLFRILVGWAPSEKILDFISSVSVKLDMIQHDKHTVQSRELTPTGFLYFCFQEGTRFF